MATPAVADLFGQNLTPVQLAERYEKFRKDLRKALTGSTDSTDPNILTKAWSSDSAIASVRESLAAGDVRKDLELTGPGTTGGLHQYDLEAPAKNLVPRKTPLRNRIARKRGVGTAHEFKRITGFTGSSTGGVPAIHPGMTETETNPFGSLNLRRGKVIQYAGDQVSVPYRRFSLSDRVTWDAYHAGLGGAGGGFDLQALSVTSTLHASMLVEERMLLGGRGTASAFSGALDTPTAPTVTTPVASGDQEAVTGVSGANVYVKITATTVWGETDVSAVGNSAFSAGDVVTITWPHVPGATGYNVFVGQGASAPAAGSIYFQTTTAANTVTLTGAIKTTGRTTADVNAANSPTAHASGYDGILAYLMDPAEAGALSHLNGPLTSDGPLQDMFATMWDTNQADPDTVFANGHDRLTLSNFLTSQSSASYRITIDSGPNGNNGTVGALASAMQNGVTGKMIELAVHPMMPRGVMPVISWNLPHPDSEVSECWAVVNVTDYQGVTWPVIEFTRDFSTFWIGSFCAYAPAWSGCLAGITS